MTNDEHLDAIIVKCREIIALGAGPAEAAARSTIAAIEGLLEQRDMLDDWYQPSPIWMGAEIRDARSKIVARLNSIIAAWPEDML